MKVRYSSVRKRKSWKWETIEEEKDREEDYYAILLIEIFQVALLVDSRIYFCNARCLFCLNGHNKTYQLLLATGASGHKMTIRPSPTHPPEVFIFIFCFFYVKV